MTVENGVADPGPLNPDIDQGHRPAWPASIYTDDVLAPEPDWRTACTVGLLGDCTVACTYLPRSNRAENHLRVRLNRAFPGQPVLVRNMSADGESAGVFMKSGRMARVFNRFFHLDIAFIRYGINDRKEGGIDECIANLEKLCQELRNRFPNITIIVESSIWVDYPAHYLFDRNPRLAPLFDAMAAMARRAGLPFLDIFDAMRQETARGNWDLRVRGYPAGDNIIVDDRFDQFFGHDPAFFTNVHPNSQCVALMADWETRKLQELFGTHLPVTATV